MSYSLHHQAIFPTNQNNINQIHNSTSDFLMLPHDMIIQFISLERQLMSYYCSMVEKLVSCLALEDTISINMQTGCFWETVAVNRRPHLGNQNYLSFIHSFIHYNIIMLLPRGTASVCLWSDSIVFSIEPHVLDRTHWFPLYINHDNFIILKHRQTYRWVCTTQLNDIIIT